MELREIISEVILNKIIEVKGKLFRKGRTQSLGSKV